MAVLFIARGRDYSPYPDFDQLHLELNGHDESTILFDFPMNTDFPRENSITQEAPIYQNSSTSTLSQSTQYFNQIPQNVFPSPAISGSPSFRDYSNARRNISTTDTFTNRMMARSSTTTTRIAESYSLSFCRFSKASSRSNHKQDEFGTNASNLHHLPVLEYTPPSTFQTSHYKNTQFETVQSKNVESDCFLQGNESSLSYYRDYLKQSSRFISIRENVGEVIVSSRQFPIDTSSNSDSLNNTSLQQTTVIPFCSS